MELLDRTMNLEEIKDYLLGNIAQSWENDVGPILSGRGGFFILPREFFCYCDFLGSFYIGLQERAARQGRQVRQAAESYMDEILGEIDEGYRDNRTLLYEMYRHGTVHAYLPKTLRNLRDGRMIISWLPYRGAREQWQYLEHKSVEIRHLLPVTLDNNVFRMPVSIDCLYWDLLESIKKYVDIMDTQSPSGNNMLVQNFNQFRNFLTTYEPTTLTW